jgi:hypothetical protein
MIKGIDLLDFFRGKINARRMWVLIKGLVADPSTNTHRSIGGPWSLADLLLAAVVDDVRLGNYILAAANSPKGKNPLPLPKPIPRPGVTEHESDNVTTKRFGQTTKSPDEVRAILASFNPVDEKEE